MKAKKRNLARRLREQGKSVREIAAEITCSKSSISKWVRDIPLTAKQIARLKSNQDKGRAKAAQHPNSPKQKWGRIRNSIIEDASKEIPDNFSKLSLKISCTALYWAEGYNASRTLFLFSNSNADMIRLMMKFLREVCKIPEKKIKGRINIHPHLSIKKAENYWINVTGIPKQNFNKPLTAVSKASKQKKDSLPFGTFNIIICDVRFVSRIKGWIKGLARWAVSSFG